MGISDSQKLDALWKRVFYSLAGTNVPPAKEYYNESIPSYTPTLNQQLWLDSDSIPTIAPVASSSVVQVYNSTVAVQMTADPTVPGNATWLATSSYGQVNTLMTDWVNPGLDASYIVKVYSGNPLQGGIFLNQTSTNQEWIFDYAGGVLRFPNTVPPGLSQVWLVGYRYTGRKGVPTRFGATVVGNTGQIDINNLILGEMVFSKNDGSNQWVLYMVSNLNPLVLTPITTQSGTPLATPDSTLTRLIVPTSPAVITFGTLSAGTVVTEVEVDVITAFDSTPTLSIGDDQNQQSLMLRDDIDLNNVGDYTTLSNYNVMVNTQFRAYFDTASSTVGVAQVSITYINKSTGTTGKITTFIQNLDTATLNPLSLGMVQIGQQVLTTEIAVSTPFNGDATQMTVSIGTSSDHNLLIADVATDLSVTDTYTNESNYMFDSTDEVFVYFNTAGSTQGFATIAITLTQ